jgi:hypothetical protein
MINSPFDMEDLNEEYGLSSFENFYDKFLGNSMKQANDKNQEWRDDRDVDKAFEEFVKDRIIWWNGLTPNRLKAVVKDMKAFAKFYAQRCGVEVDGECEHPYHSIVGGNGSPERCLKCGRVLSE